LTWNPFRLLSKRVFGNINWIANRRKHFFEEQLTPLPKLFKELNVDLVLLGGDFSTTSLKEEFEKAAAWVKKIEPFWIAIPGNHDRYTKKSCKGKHFYRYITNTRHEITHPAMFFKLKDQRIEAHKIQEGWWVIALDTCLATHLGSSEGLFSLAQEKYFRELLALIPKEDKIILFNHYPFFHNDAKSHNLVRGEELQKLIESEPRILLYLHGHTHRHSVADLQPCNLPIVLDSGSCAQGRKGAWNLIDIEPKGCKISTYRWDHRWTKTRTEGFEWKRK
jgi:3',5'-cyclic AMP phosphodiesterase CpdA